MLQRDYNYYSRGARLEIDIETHSKLQDVECESNFKHY